jgi:replicative DNA helicase
MNDAGDIFEPPERTLPQNVGAEQSLLGAILLDNDAFHKVAAMLEPEHFFMPVHRRIYNAARKLIGRGQIASPVTLKAYFDADDALTEIGGAEYLARLAGGAVSIISAPDYARVIRDLSKRRGLIDAAERTLKAAYDPKVDETAATLIEESEARLYGLAEDGAGERGPVPFGVALTRAIEAAEIAYKRGTGLAGLSTGITALDNVLGGLAASDLVVVAGRPSMGKTALAGTIAWHVARTEEVPVGFFSLEMAAEQLATRVIAEATGIRSDHIRRGKLSNDDFFRLASASRELAVAPLFIDDTPALTIAAVHTRARRLKRQHGIGLVVVDYLQLVQPARAHASRVEDVSEITQGLKALAKDLQVPVLALSQLSRAVESRDDKRPLLSDLRESGTIEQDADVVMFIYREEHYLERGAAPRTAKEREDQYAERLASHEARLANVRGLAEVIGAKHRHGPVFTCQLVFDAPLTTFRDRAPEVSGEKADEALAL